jgi:MoxR-like ATPase
MKNSIQKQIQEATAAVRAFLSSAREALNGRRAFSPDDLRAIAEPLEQMAPIAAQIAELRSAEFGLTADFREYADSLDALNETLEQVRFMLLARQSSLQASRSHVETLNLWTTRLNETR